VSGFFRAKEIFFAAQELAGEERARHLDEACGGDAGLRAEVERLLHADEKAGALLESPEIAGYRVVRLLGRGGMGDVYEAEQEAPRRPVALKIVRTAVLDESLARRFEFEAESLGRLNHPGIARIHEAGLSGAQPYFAMELVEGEVLTRHADRRGLDARARLALVARICEAVEHAHQRGVIHRDLKPANILVDADGQPKLLDFGIAKLAGREARASLATLPGQLLGTIPYMSPEQVSGDPAAVDLRADVYALGVIAYELLAGELPIDTEGRVITDAIEAVRRDEPARLGTVDGRLRGDVETIVGKALRKDPAARYDSAGALGDDIERYLRDEPIAARPPSAAYQLRKFARRHRALVGTVAVAMLALLAGAVTSTAFYLRAEEQRLETKAAQEEAAEEARRANAEAKRANEEAERARIEAETASQTLGFLTEMFRAENPYAGEPGPKTTRELLDRGAARLLDGRPDDPDVRTELMVTVASIYVQLGLHANAAPLIEAAMPRRRAQGDDEPAALYAALDVLGHVREGLGEHAAAVAVREEMVAFARARLGPEDLTKALLLIGRMKAATRFLDDAEQAVREVLDDLGPDPSARAHALHVLSIVQRRTARPAEAARTAEEALAEAERLFPEGSPRRRPFLMGLGTAYLAVSRHADATECFRKVVDRDPQWLNPDHPKRFAARNLHARSLYMLGRMEEAERIQATVVEEAEEHLGESHPSLPEYLTSLIEIRRQLRGTPGLEPLARRAIELQRRVRPDDDSPAIVRQLLTLGEILSDELRYAEAGEVYEEALAIAERLGNRGLRGDAASDLAWNLMNRGLLEDAEKRAVEAVGHQAAAHGEHSMDVAAAYNTLASIHQRRGRPAEAAAAFRKSAAIYTDLHGPGHVAVAMVELNLVSMLRQQGELDEAEDLVRRLIDGDPFPRNSPANLEMRRRYAEVLYAKTSYADAEKVLRELLPDWVATFGLRHPSTGSVFLFAGRAAAMHGEHARAEKYLRKSEALLRDGRDRKQHAFARLWLAHCLVNLGRRDEATPHLDAAEALLPADHADVVRFRAEWREKG